MMHLRAKLASDDVIREMWGRFSSKRHRWLSVQGIAEIALHLFASVFAIGNVLAIYVFAVKTNWYLTMLFAVVPVLVLIFQIAVAVTLGNWEAELLKGDEQHPTEAERRDKQRATGVM
jgi:hypothetical protein